MLAQAFAKAPGLLVKPQLEALGFEWDEKTGALVDLDDGATHVGFSREGVARKSKIADHAMRMKAANDLVDRIFGKPRQAVELGAEGSGMAVAIVPKDAGRYRAVAKVLLEAGAIPGGNETTTNDDDAELAE